MQSSSFYYVIYLLFIIIFIYFIVYFTSFIYYHFIHNVSLLYQYGKLIIYISSDYQ